MLTDPNISNYQYLANNFGCPSSQTQIHTVVALSGQKVIVHVDDQDSLTFRLYGLLFDPEDQSIAEFCMNGYPTDNETITFYTVPTGKQLVGKMHVINTNQDETAYYNLAVDYAEAENQIMYGVTENESVANVYYVDGFTSYKAKDVYLKAGDILYARCGSAFINLRYSGILYDADNKMELITGGLLGDFNGYRSLYTCPATKRATVSVDIICRYGAGWSPSGGIYVRNINLTSDPNGTTGDGLAGGGGGPPIG